MVAQLKHPSAWLLLYYSPPPPPVKIWKAYILRYPQQNSPNQYSLLSHRMVIVLSSTSSTSAGLHTETHPPPSALCSKWSDDWRNGRSNMMEERVALWSTACESCWSWSDGWLDVWRCCWWHSQSEAHLVVVHLNVPYTSLLIHPKELESTNELRCRFSKLWLPDLLLKQNVVGGLLPSASNTETSSIL